MSPKPRILLIRHGEKPAHDLPGLNAKGIARAKGLVEVFGSQSEYDIRHVFAQKPHADGKRARPFQTVGPLAESLKLQVDVSREREEVGPLAADLKGFVSTSSKGGGGGGKGDVLVCWEHKRLHDILLALGVKHPPQYDGGRYDLLWVLEEPYGELRELQYTFKGEEG